MIRRSTIAFLFFVFFATGALAQVPVEGWVYDSDGSPMPGCRVEFDGPNESQRTNTDEEGSFQLFAEQGDYRVLVDCHGLSDLFAARITTDFGLEPAAFVLD